MAIAQIIYASQPFGYDDATLSSILMDARRCNKRDNITGALVCRHDIFLQLLEGPSDVIEATYTRILKDDRHLGIEKLVSRNVKERMFDGWDMLHDPAKSWLWSAEEIDAGVLERASEDEIAEVFANLADKVAQSDPA